MIDRLIAFALQHRLLTLLLVRARGDLGRHRLRPDAEGHLSGPERAAGEDHHREPGHGLGGCRAADLAAAREPAVGRAGRDPRPVRIDHRRLGGDGGVRLGHRHLPRAPDRLQQARADCRADCRRTPRSRCSARCRRAWARCSSSRWSATGVDPMELRSVADWTIRYQLQGVPGVAFIINLGGFVKQFHVLLRPGDAETPRPDGRGRPAGHRAQQPQLLGRGPRRRARRRR